MLLVTTVVRGEKGKGQMSQGSLPSFCLEITRKGVLVRDCLITYPYEIHQGTYMKRNMN